MSQTIVIDAQPLLALINGEPGYEEFKAYFTSMAWRRIITPLTLFELKLSFLRKGIQSGEQAMALSFVKSLCQVVEIKESVALRAAELRFKYMQSDQAKTKKANISMADAIYVALAEEQGCPLLTRDYGLRQTTEAPTLP